MYTRCPSCRAEISFEPPANMETLPDGYKHRIKCPSCGVTIGVKINKIDTSVTQPVYAPQNPYASSPEPVYQAPVQEEEVAPAKEKKAKSAKKSGAPRNVFMLLCSLIFIALSVVGYLVNIEKIPTPEGFSWVGFFGNYDGISVWDDLVHGADGLKLLFSLDTALGFVAIIPMIMFILACLTFLVDFICLCCKKYVKLLNLLFAVVVGGFAIVWLFNGLIFASITGTELGFKEYFTDRIFAENGYLLIAVAGFGLLYILASIIFTAVSLKRKRA